MLYRGALPAVTATAVRAAQAAVLGLVARAHRQEGILLTLICFQMAYHKALRSKLAPRNWPRVSKEGAVSR
jgi:hypothetical protein